MSGSSDARQRTILDKSCADPVFVTAFKFMAFGTAVVLAKPEIITHTIPVALDDLGERKDLVELADCNVAQLHQKLPQSFQKVIEPSCLPRFGMHMHRTADFAETDSGWVRNTTQCPAAWTAS